MTRDVHARYFAGQETRILALWAGPGNGEANAWLGRELANLRAGFRWAADHGDLDTAAPITITACMIGWWTLRFEPFGWAEELLDTARASGHRRLLALTAMASLCAMMGRVDDGVRYGDAAMAMVGDARFDLPPFGYVGFWAGAAHLGAGRPDQCIGVYLADIERTGDPLTFARAGLAVALHQTGNRGEAMTLVAELIAVAEATANPGGLAVGCWVYAMVFRGDDPRAALGALRRGLSVAADSGNRYIESICASALAVAEVQGPRSAGAG